MPLGMVIQKFKVGLFLHFLILIFPWVAPFLSRLTPQMDTHCFRSAIYILATPVGKEVLIHGHSQLWLSGHVHRFNLITKARNVLNSNWPVWII